MADAIYKERQRIKMKIYLGKPKLHKQDWEFELDLNSSITTNN